MNEVDVLKLIETKSFEELTPEERKFVLEKFSELEYTIQAELIGKSRKLFQEEKGQMIPNPNILESLQEFNKRNKQKSVWVSIVSWQIPAYQVAIAAIVLFVFFLPLWKNEVAPPLKKEVVVYQTIHDTIQVIKEVPVEKIVTIYKEVFADAPVNIHKVEVSEGITPMADSIKLQDITQNLANTSLNKELLNQFFVGVR